MLPTKFRVSWPFGSGEEAKNRFSRCLGPAIQTVLAIFDLQVTPKLPNQVRVSWPFGSEEVKNSFKDGHHGGHLGFRIGKILLFFLSTSHPDASYQVSSQLAFQFRRRSEK